MERHTTLPENLALSRAGVAATACSLLAAASAWPAVPRAASQVWSAPFPDAVGSAGTLLIAAVSGWTLLVVITGVVTNARFPGVPRAVHAALFTTVAVTVLAAPANADGRHDLDGLPLPDRPIVGEFRSTDLPSRSAGTVTVRPGDTLWGLAASHTARRGASNAEIASACASLYENNQDAIGPDPNLIRPGLVLRLNEEAS